MNVVLLTIDALRPDHLSLYGYARKTDAALDPYRNHLAVFENAYTYSFPTVRAFPALLASAWPSLCTSDVPWQYFRKINLPKTFKILPEHFHDHDYFCAVHTCWNAFLTPPQGYARGADRYVGMLREDDLASPQKTGRLFAKIAQTMIYALRYFPSDKAVLGLEQIYHWLRDAVNMVFRTKIKEPPGVAGRSGKAVTDYVLNAVKQNKQRPFFVWAHYLDSHVPFSPPDEFTYDPAISPKIKQAITNAILRQEPVSTDIKKNLIDLYDGGIRTAFHHVGRIFDYLEANALLERTCVVITADHGYGLWEHGFWETPSGRFFNESIRVPLIIYDPKIIHREKRITAPVSLMDLPPTLLELAGIQSKIPFFGKSFSPLLKDEKVKADGLWLESTDMKAKSNLLCRLEAGRKIIYQERQKRVLSVLDSNDEPLPVTPEEEKTFLAALSDYAEAKRSFLARRNKNTVPK